MNTPPVRLKVWRAYADLPWELDRFDHPVPREDPRGLGPGPEVVEVMPVAEHQRLAAEHRHLQSQVREALSQLDGAAGDQAGAAAALQTLREAVIDA